MIFRVNGSVSCFVEKKNKGIAHKASPQIVANNNRDRAQYSLISKTCALYFGVVFWL